MTINERKALRAIEAKQIAYERELQQLYVSQLKEIRSIMTDVYDKYASDGVLTKAEMTKYSRLATLEAQLVKLSGATASQAAALIKRMQPDMYNESFFRRAWAIDMDNEVRLSYGLINPNAVKETLINDMEKISLQKYGNNARTGIRQALQNGLIKGQSYQEMAFDLKKNINMLAFEALRIMRTEGQTAQNAGAAEVYERAEKEGIKGREIWVATLDDSTRESHQDMDGVPMEDDGLFHIPATDKTDAETAPYPGWEGLSAGNRINCFTEAMIPIAVDTEKLYKRFYSGRIVKIKTALGAYIEITPNHPILTDKGWIRACEANEGTNIVSMLLGKEFDFGNDIQNAPSTFGKIYDLFSVGSMIQRALNARIQFHGDGSIGEVEIKSFDRCLPIENNAVFSALIKDKILTIPNVLHGGASGNSPGSQFIDVSLHAPDGIMCSFRQVLSFLGACFGHPQEHSIASVSLNNSISIQDGSNSASLAKEVFGALLDGYSRQIMLDKVIMVDDVDYFGHVYNLQTKSGLYGVYSGNDIVSITHNCRCTTRFEVEGYSPQVRRSKEDGVIPYQTYDQWKKGRQK